MPIDIDLGNPPAGYSLTAARPGAQVAVQYLEFTSSEDGQHFIKRLEGIPNDILLKVTPRVQPSQIDSLLAIVRADGSATVYVNELVQTARVSPSRPVQAGEPVTKNDIVDVDRLDLGVKIPDDMGFLFVFSVGWRKGLFYDFGPVVGLDPQPRQYDVDKILGQAYCHVLFQERFSISDDEWDALFSEKWFPFAGLSNESIDALISQIRCGWELDEKLDDFTAEVNGSTKQMLDSWRAHSSFAPHIEILDRAVERFRDEDYVSCTGLLFPRIEGLLRTHHTSLGISSRPSPYNLTSTAVASKIENTRCLLLPHRFAAYLRDVYFANFNPTSQDIDVSRHSVAHGVATASEFNRKSALLGILVVHQLFYCLENELASSSDDNIDISSA